MHVKVDANLCVQQEFNGEKDFGSWFAGQPEHSHQSLGGF